MKDAPLHTLSVDEFHKFHCTNDYTLYLESGSQLPFATWYSGQVSGVVSSTMQIAEANGWQFNPVQYQDGHEGRTVKWNAATNELFVRMTEPTSRSGDFSPEDLKLVLHAILTVSGPRASSMAHHFQVPSINLRGFECQRFISVTSFFSVQSSEVPLQNHT